SGGPMEAGKVQLPGIAKKVDLVDAMIAAADDRISDADVEVIERSACPLLRGPAICDRRAPQDEVAGRSSLIG
ncbi:hypothetical protein MKK67_16090, partial [Methylobacterium sp. J-072]|uniref:hypothetical protein n=1 Tax=Methylobacterium sp. J-072 TaxID=2836651 RepID=UPI001FBA68DE